MIRAKVSQKIAINNPVYELLFVYQSIVNLLIASYYMLLAVQPPQAL